MYLFNLRSGVLIKTLSHIWGKFNLPILLFRVGFLTLINMDSLTYLDKWVDKLFFSYPSDLMKSTVVDESLSSMNLQFCS